MSDIKLTDDLKDALKTLVCDFDKEDRSVRERQIRLWRKMKYYWEGLQQVWFSEVAHDYRIFDAEAQSEGGDQDQAAYDKPVNVFRAWLESIIAALSVNIPDIKCFPDDAENSLDIATSKAGDRIAALVSKHNNASLLWLHALYIFCTEGMVAAYNYSKEDSKYGTYSKPKYKDEKATLQNKVCPNCGTNLGSKLLSDEKRDEYNPGDAEAPMEDLLKEGDLCPQCMVHVDPKLQDEEISIRRLVGATTEPKAKQCIEAYGGLYIKVAIYARNQSETPYLIYAYETDYSNIFQQYPELVKDEKFRTSATKGNGMTEPYERWARMSLQYRGEYPLNTPTVRYCWLRPSSYYRLNDDNIIKALQEKFPDGAKVMLVNDTFVDACNECLDDHWTLTYNPMSDFIYHDPLGTNIIPIQDMTNDLFSLILQTIEHGIGQTFVDSEVINLSAYSQMSATPGAIYAAKARSGKTLGDSFFNVKTATLAPEVEGFMQRVQEAGQIVSGAMPSLFGGAAPNSSKTASQYAMSRAQSLQRLQGVWKIFVIWWKEIFGKVIPSFIEDMVEDERYVVKGDDGNFLNVFIRMSDTEGKIGGIELESSEQLPASWAQKRDTILQLFQASNPEVMAALSDPKNIPMIREAIGLDDFVVPGEDDRNKQFEEIQLLLKGTPITTPGPNPMGPGLPPVPTPMPSVQVEPDVDNHVIQASVCREWAVSESGRQTKLDNPAGYQNVLLHLREHLKLIPPPPQMMQGPSNAAGSAKQNPKPIAAPVKKNASIQ